ncbi:MAG: protein kinase [Candidatus Sulfotelmatobacter sp.]
MADQVIGHYRVLEKIGSGAMGVVFRARDERLGRDVALKLICPGSNDNPDHLRRFELEARAAAALNHPNIVAVYDVGFDNGVPYIVCELLEGKTLRTKLSECPLQVRTAVDYALQIVRGLVAAHDRRIIHRDLKPENLFVTGDGRVKILDFGVAKLQSAPDESGRSIEDRTTVTKAGAVIGTVAYMSPEQLRGKSIDHRSDIFAMGAILYEMLTGLRAFHGETEVDTITAVLRENPPEIKLEEANVPVACRQIVQHCLEKEPENRFQSARDLGFALETLATATSGRAPRIELPRKRSRVVPWAIASVLLIATSMLVGSQLRAKNPSLSYRRLTFEQGTIYSARFAPDFQGIVYGAAWNGRPLQLFSSVGDSLLTQPLNVADANLLAVSRTGELALVLHGQHSTHLQTDGGMLARTPLAGGSPREILEDVAWADWDAGGELAVVHRVQGRDQIEYPVGHVLYRSPGWITHLRLSPSGDSIAFMDHPIIWDDRGSVAIVDRSGKFTILSTGWESEDGLAWGPDAKEVWFTAVEKGYSRALFGVSMSGKLRKVLELPTGMTLEDAAPDGRALVSMDSERLAMAGQSGDGKPVDLSWHDWSVAKDISSDGQSVLFEDSSEAAGPHYSVAIRKMDGSSLPVQLGEGSAGGLSPDGKWAISILSGAPAEVRVIPIGPGQARTINISGLENINNGTAHFLADGKHITISGNEPGHGVRCYLIDLDGGKPKPITPEGVGIALVSPDGQHLLRSNSAHETAVYPMSGGEPHPIPNLWPGFFPLRWSQNSTDFYAYRPGYIPAEVLQINSITGEKRIVQDLQPETLSGVVSIAPVVISRDGSRFAYSYYQLFSVLYLISGLR